MVKPQRNRALVNKKKHVVTNLTLLRKPRRATKPLATINGVWEGFSSVFVLGTQSHSRVTFLDQNWADYRLLVGWGGHTFTI